MARYTGPECKLCRREGEKLYLKGERCFSPKCAFERRGYAPGAHGRGGRGRSGQQSDYARQLRAKQRARRIYGVTERPFRRFFGMAIRRRGPTGLNLLHLLETRLDNVVYRLGWASSRPQARQLVSHGHFLVNGRRADIPSMILKPGDQITLAPTARDLTYFKELPELAAARPSATWLDRDLDSMVGRVLRYPERSEIEGAINEQLIVEYYSR